MLTKEVPNLAPEYVSVCFLFVILIVALFTNRIKTRQLRMTILSFIIAVICLVSELVSYAVYPYLDNQFAIFLGYLSNSLYYLTIIMIIYLSTIYVFTYVINDEHNFYRLALYFSIPIILVAICLIINVITPNHFWFSYSYIDGYQKGIGYIVNYCIAGIYIILIITLLFIYKSRLERNVRILLMFYPLGTIFIGMIQLLINLYWHLNIEIQGTGIVLIIIIVYIFLTNRQSNTDDLTGLFTRQLLLKKTQLIINQKKTNFKLLLIDIRRFRVVNDKYGSYVGDKTLKQVAQFISQIVYPEPTYLYTGNIFAIVLTKQYYEKGEELITKIHQRFDEPWYIDNHIIDMSCAIGTFDSKFTFDKQIYFSTFVDFFLKHMKDNSNEKNICCSIDLLKSFEREIQVIEAVTKAIENKSFSINIQPIYNLDKNRYTSGEVLARLFDEKLLNITPTEFIGVAEKKSMVNQIDYIILEKACQTLSYFQEINLPIDSLSVNFSPLIFKETDCVEKIISLIHKYDISPTQICIEITEKAIIESTEDATIIMNRLKETGIKIYLDDFGVGNSNLSSVMSLPIDIVKIDKMLIDSAVKSRDSAQFLKSMIQIFNDDHIKVICEGVSTREQLDIIRDTSCSLIQGYYFCQPLPIDKFIKIIKQ